MRILSVGGGSGGHVTPVLAVLNELKRLDPSLEAMFVCDHAFEAQSRGLMKHAGLPVPVHTVYAGKLRRYHGVAWYRQLLDIPTTLKNIRDVFLVALGAFQSLVLLARFKPDVVFAKGGYVCLPVGLAARLRRIPLVIHDSDARPGLTNSILARWAVRIGTGSPLENYHYPPEISSYVGVPIDQAFHPFTDAEKRKAKAALGVSDLNKPLVVITGGGLGARNINDAATAVAPQLLEQGLAVYHVTGKKYFARAEKQLRPHADYTLVPFVFKDMAAVLGAADVVVSRGSATFLQELAALAKPVVIVPAGHLGDQIKNGEVYAQAQAAIVLNDNELKKRPVLLLEAISQIITDPVLARRLSGKLHAFARPDAALDVARLVVEAAAERKQGK